MEEKFGGKVDEKTDSLASPANSAKKILGFIAGMAINSVVTLIGSAITGVILSLFVEKSGQSDDLPILMFFSFGAFLFALFPVGFIVSLLFLLLEKRFASLQKYGYAMRFCLIFWALGLIFGAALWIGLK